MQTDPDEVPGLLTFRLGHRTFGIPLARVAEIVRMVAVTPIPEVPVWMLGVVNLRGSHIPIIDLHARLNVEGSPPDAASRIIVVECGAGRSGLVVDEVTDVLAEEPDELEMIDSFRPDAQPAPAIARIGTETVMILDVDGVARGIHDLHLPEGLDAGV